MQQISNLTYRKLVSKMNKNKPSLDLNGSSSSHQIIQLSQEPSRIVIESVEFSIQNLLKNWQRRRKWKLFFNNIPNNQNHLITISPWRTKLVDFLESKQIRAIVISLIILDLILTTLELTSALLSCQPIKNRHNSITQKQQTWYHWLGIAILSLLLAKIVALAVGLGGGAFLRRPVLVVDAAVVAAALVLEGFLERKGGGLLVVVSLWRVVRVVEGAFELSDDVIEAQIEGIVRQFEVLREENKMLLQIIGEKDEVIEKLQQDLDRCREDFCSSI